MEKIILIGAGGHCKVIIDVIKSSNKYEIVGIIDNSNKEKHLIGIPVIGNDRILYDTYSKGVDNAFVCVGALEDIKIRAGIYSRLKNIGFKLPVLIHEDAIVSPYANIEEGTCIMAGAIVNVGAYIKSNCIINTASVIEHDCKIGFNCHISPNVTIAGGVVIEDNSHIGIGSTIIQGINIGKNVTIGAGAVVINDIEDNSVAVGVPAKILRKKI